MPRRLTNDLLLTLILLQVLGGVLGWALPVETARPLYGVHRALGVAVLLVLGWKQAIVLASLRRRLARRDRTTLWGAIAAMGLVTTLALGLAWTLNLISFDWLWGYSPLNVHVIVGVGLVPLVALHVRARWRHNAASAPIRSRRALLRVSGLALGTLVGWQAIEHLAPAVRLPTGSKPAGSFNANGLPAEIWLFDSVPLLDARTWRLRVGARDFTLDELVRLHSNTEVQAVLDCTSGWWSEQVWSGVHLLDVLHTAGLNTQAVAAVSVTGHRIVLPVTDLGEAILATHVGGEPLAPGHGYPLRLVVPGYRGYHWVKWLASLEPA
jgi:DMSO/TMAO reductase YedYZ molybdopterin-dependent catalytic subunit